MASGQERFDSQKIRDEIFQSRNRDILTTIMFVTKTAKILTEKGRKSDCVFITYRAIEILQGNLILTKVLLLSIVNFNVEPLELLKYHLAVAKVSDDSINEKMMMDILVQIGNEYNLTSHYKEAIEYTLVAENIAHDLKDNSGKASCYTTLGNSYLKLGENKKAIDYYKKGLQISTEIGDRKEIAINNGSLGNVYHILGEYQKAVNYYKRSLQISTEVGDRSGIANSNGNLGNAYSNLGEYQKAIDFCKTGLQINTEIGDRSGIASNNATLGYAYINLGEYEKSIDFCKRGLQISTEIGDRSRIASNNETLGNAYFNLGEYQKAIDYNKRDLQISNEIGNRSGIADKNENLGVAYVRLGEYQKAIDCYKRGLQISTEIGDRSGRASNNERLGNVYFNLGEYQKAIDYCNRGLQISTEIGDRSGIASKNEMLGNVYFKLGEYQKAIDYYKRGLQISTEIGYRSRIATMNRNLGNVYVYLGEYQKAIDYCNRGLQISTEIGEMSGIARNNETLGNVYFKLGEYQKAIDYYNRGLEISTEIGDRIGTASNTGNLGNTCLNLGMYQKAIDYYNRGLQISTEIGDRSGIACNNGNLGNAYVRIGEYKKAIDYYNRGLQISTEIGDRSGIAIKNGNLGHCYLLQGCLNVDNEEAVSLVQQAAVYLEESVMYSNEIFEGLALDENKISFTKEHYIWHKLLMYCFIFLKRIDAALLVIDLGKAKALHAILEKQNHSESDIMSYYTSKTWKRIHDNEEKMQTKEIENILDLKTNNATVLLFSFDTFEFLDILVVNGEDDIKLDVGKESKDMTSHEEYIYDNLNKLLKVVSVDLKRDSSFTKLDSDFISIEQMIMPTQLARKLVNVETNSRFQRTPCPKYQSGDSILETHENILRNLYRVLIEPVKDWIKGTKLIIVPDKFLFFLPFCALLDENGCPLAENYCIEVTPSLHTLVSSITRSRDSNLGYVLFVGNPTLGKISFGGENIEPCELPGATEEVKCLAPLFEAQPLVEGEATKERVLRFINGASIIHIAAHGESERGEILLSPSLNVTEESSSLPKEDSYLLKEQDIMKIGINASLVVLSCCHTGKGNISCEGVVGLTRAFLAAGARSVLATLWRIHDEATKEFMSIFYDKVCNEISVCEALRTTMKMFHMHQNKDFRSFQIWAPFTIYGEDVRFTKGDIEEIKEKSREFNDTIKSI